MLNAPVQTVSRPQTLRAIQVAIVAGFLSCLAYPASAIAHLPVPITAFVAVCFGPALAIACYGLRQLLDLEKPLVSSVLGLLLAAIAGTLFSAMGVVELATISSLRGQKPSAEMSSIWQGLEAAFAAYICLATCCFALAMFNHPRFGRVFAFSGFAVAFALFALHLLTFPAAPRSAGPLGLGPAIGLWYFFVTVQMWRSFAWARQRLLQTARLDAF